MSQEPIFSVKTAGVLTAVVGTVYLPWLFLQTTDLLFLFYSFIGSMFGPMAGIMLAHFFFIRRNYVDLDMIYLERGDNGSYTSGINTRAIAVLALSFIVTMVGAVAPNAPFFSIANQFAFFVGLIIGFFGYLIVSSLGARTPGQ